jgi:hypothetical protein
MSQSEWYVRSARLADRELLSTFECANPNLNFETEVEQYIRGQLIDWTFDPHAVSGDPRLLLVLTNSTSELVAVAAHERQVMESQDRSRFDVTKLEVAAVALSWQGRRFATGERVSDVLMSAVMADISARVPPRDARVYAVVHQDNGRSIALCRRYGITEEMSSPSPGYRRLVTQHKTPSLEENQ